MFLCPAPFNNFCAPIFLKLNTQITLSPKTKKKFFLKKVARFEPWLLRFRNLKIMGADERVLQPTILTALVHMFCIA